MNKRILSVLLTLALLFSLTLSAFAAPNVSTKTVTSFNDTVSISNVIKTSDPDTDKSFDVAKTYKKLEVSDKHRTDNSELYFCSAAPVTITLKKDATKGDYGITGYQYYYMDVASEPSVNVTKYNVSVYDYNSDSEEKVTAQAFSGTITLKNPGSYYLYLTNRSASGEDCDVGIYIVVGGSSAIATTAIKLSKTTATLAVAKTITLTATIAPSNATKKTVTWTSSNTKVAIVDKNGKVTAKAKGTATITCKATDGSGKTATCKVTVK